MKKVNLVLAIAATTCALSVTSCSQEHKPQTPPKQVYAEDW